MKPTASSSWLSPIPGKRTNKIVTDKMTEVVAVGDKQLMEKAIANSINQWDALAFNSKQ